MAEREKLTLTIKNIQSQVSINDMHVNKNGNSVFHVGSCHPSKVINPKYTL